MCPAGHRWRDDDQRPDGTDVAVVDPDALCPLCHEPWVRQERRPDGYRYCANNHSWQRIRRPQPPAVNVTGLDASPAGPARNMPIVSGRCPACGMASLFLAVGGHVTCSNLSCSNPTKIADDLLAPAGAGHDDAADATLSVVDLVEMARDTTTTVHDLLARIAAMPNATRDGALAAAVCALALR